jgi:hypothetical protein
MADKNRKRRKGAGGFSKGRIKSLIKLHNTWLFARVFSLIGIFSLLKILYYNFFSLVGE